MTEGVVKWFDSEREFGFIAGSNGGPDLLVEGVDILYCGGEGLEPGQRVEFDITVVPKGPQALRVRPI